MQPPTYESPAAPLSVWTRWAAVSAALRDYGNVLTEEIDPDLVAATATVAAQRADWETVDRMAVSVDLDAVVNAPRAARIESSLDATNVAGLLEKGRLAAASDFCTRVLRRAHILPRVKLSDEQQMRDRQRRMLEQHLATPAPEFVDLDQRLVAAAALACQVELGNTEVAQVVAADVLFTTYTQEMQAATTDMVQAAAPAVQ
ncbi:MAG TPA: hypothetical protein VLF62_00950 [Candidatus Saccharimonadales bacterium]|nr:hypothetical protein [Candidatus Saccharimonadales bacterium]